MPQPSIYYTDDDTTSFTPSTFVEEFNKHSTIHAAAATMGISAKRLSVIGTRLRKRGMPVKRHDTERYVRN